MTNIPPTYHELNCQCFHAFVAIPHDFSTTKAPNKKVKSMRGRSKAAAKKEGEQQPKQEKELENPEEEAPVPQDDVEPKETATEDAAPEEARPKRRIRFQTPLRLRGSLVRARERLSARVSKFKDAEAAAAAAATAAAATAESELESALSHEHELEEEAKDTFEDAVWLHSIEGDSEQEDAEQEAADRKAAKREAAKRKSARRKSAKRGGRRQKSRAYSYSVDDDDNFYDDDEAMGGRIRGGIHTKSTDRSGMWNESWDDYSRAATTWTDGTDGTDGRRYYDDNETFDDQTTAFLLKEEAVAGIDIAKSLLGLGSGLGAALLCRHPQDSACARMG